MNLARQVGSLYARIVRAYFGWARILLPLAIAVFVPLGLVHAVPIHAHLDSIDVSHGLKALALLAAVGTLTATGLLGEVFYTGAVSIALTHPRVGGRPPSMREVIRQISYGRLIAVDLLYGLFVAAGLIALIVPGIVAYVYLGLTAPVVEIEGRGIRQGFARSFRLVRGSFWLVLAVLGPLELAGDALANLATDLAARLLSGSLLAEWFADTASNIVLTPFYAVAAVLLTLDLIAARDGSAPRLHSAPGRR